MRGTANQAAELRPEKPGFAGNINLSKLAPDAEPIIRRVMAANNDMAGARRGVVPDAEVRAGAVEKALGMTPVDWVKTRAGKGYAPEEATAIGLTMEAVRKEWDDLKAAAVDLRKSATMTPMAEA
mgnify:FL=1